MKFSTKQFSKLWKGKITFMFVPNTPTSVFTLRIPYLVLWVSGLLFTLLAVSSLFLTISINHKISYYKYISSTSPDFQDQIDKANQYLPSINSSQTNTYKQLMSVFSSVGIPQDQHMEDVAEDMMQGDNTLFLEYLEQKVKNINMYVTNFQTFFKSIPAILPTNAHFYISSPFGWRIHPILKKRYFHEGIDLAIMPGTPVVATADGTVIQAGMRGGYGIGVFIRHNEGYETRYGHMMRLAAGITKNATVRRGQVIGYVGDTGLATGYHLHYEVRINDEAVEPSRFFYLDKFRI